MHTFLQSVFFNSSAAQLLPRALDAIDQSKRCSLGSEEYDGLGTMGQNDKNEQVAVFGTLLAELFSKIPLR